MSLLQRKEILATLAEIFIFLQLGEGVLYTDSKILPDYLLRQTITGVLPHHPIELGVNV